MRLEDDFRFGTTILNYLFHARAYVGFFNSGCLNIGCRLCEPCGGGGGGWAPTLFSSSEIGELAAKMPGGRGSLATWLVGYAPVSQKKKRRKGVFFRH